LLRQPRYPLGRFELQQSARHQLCRANLLPLRITDLSRIIPKASNDPSQAHKQHCKTNLYHDKITGYREYGIDMTRFNRSHRGVSLIDNVTQYRFYASTGLVIPYQDLVSPPISVKGTHFFNALFHFFSCNDSSILWKRKLWMKLF
jgi:hypothetical protein